MNNRKNDIQTNEQNTTQTVGVGASFRSAAPDNQKIILDYCLSDQDEDLNIRTMGALSSSHPYFHNILKDSLAKKKETTEKAKEALEYVLHGSQNEVIEMAKNFPAAFFVKATSQDHAVDLDGNCRTIKGWSPIQALFATGNTLLIDAVIKELDPYLANLPNGYALITKQVKEKFPHGFDYPPCADEFIKVVAALENAIDKDKSLEKTGQASPETLALLDQYRQLSKPGVVKTSHHYNMNNIIALHNIYYDHWFLWTKQQRKFFCTKVLGLQQRLMPEFYLRIACHYHAYQNDTLQLDSRSFELAIIATFVKRLDNSHNIVPFAGEDPACRLGENFVIDAFYTGGTGSQSIGKEDCTSEPLFPGMKSRWEDIVDKQKKALDDTLEAYAKLAEEKNNTPRP